MDGAIGGGDLGCGGARVLEGRWLGYEREGRGAGAQVLCLWNYDLSSPWRQGCREKYAIGIARVAHALAITLAAGANTRRGNMASRPAHVR